MKKLVIIPAYNESASIVKTVNDIKQNAPDFDYVVVNDCSTDNTLQICEEHGLNCLKLPVNLGIGGAVQSGYLYGVREGYDVAVQFDGDGQHDISYVKDIIKPILLNKADMVIGSRFIDDSTSDFKSSFARRVGINVISSVIKLKTGVKIFDTTSGFRAINRTVLEIFSNDYPREYPEPISTVNILCNGLNVSEVGVSMNERIGGVSSIKSWKTAYYMINVVLSILLMKGKKTNGK